MANTNHNDAVYWQSCIKVEKVVEILFDDKHVESNRFKDAIGEVI